MHSETHKLVTEGNDSSAPISMKPTSVAMDGTHDAEPVPKQDLVGLREQRIRDYLDSKLHNAMPEVALLGGVNADLAALALQLKTSLDEVLGECEDAREYLATLPRCAEVFLKIARQIDRGSRLINELERGQAAASQSARKRSKHSALEGGEEMRI